MPTTTVRAHARRLSQGGRTAVVQHNRATRKLNEIEQECAHAGIAVGTWAPGDGVTRYRFFQSHGGSVHGDYHAGDGVFTALGKKEAMAFIRGVRAVKNGRL